MRYYIGIDGGGTKTEGVLTALDGTVLACRSAGASNPNDVTLAGASATLTEVIEALLRDAGLTADALPTVSVFGGIAGGINHGAALEASLRDRFPIVGALGIRSDVQILLSGELPVGDGACIICGTGSACFLRRGDRLIRIGGWGYLLDSAGSGYDIGRGALEAVLRALDGRGAPTALTALIAAHLGGEVQTMITDIYRAGKPYIAACAPCVFDAAQGGDAVARELLTRNARALAEYIETAWRWLCEGREARPARMPVVMGGSISQRQPAWPRLVASLTNPAVPAEITVAAVSPVFGAVAEAAKQDAGQGGSIDFLALRRRFTETYRA